MSGFGVHLVRSDERAEAVEALADLVGGRVGLDGVLTDLTRVARRVDVPGKASWGFTWDDDDMHSARWWPQGITTSADGGFTERDVVITSAYAHEIDGVRQGARISVVDLGTLRYQHVLLVRPVDGEDGVVVRPVTLHAGGIVWHGGYLHVAGTARGIWSFRLDDLMHVPEDTGLETFGYRYLLPVRFSYDARTADGDTGLRYSFLSLDASARPPRLVAGEYGRHGQTTRLAHYEMDPATSLLRTDDRAVAEPVALLPYGVEGMQGATVVDGTYYVTNSHGRRMPGSLWVGRPGHLREIPLALPPGPEDIAYWPARDELWSVTEHPGARYVFAIPRRTARVTVGARSLAWVIRLVGRLRR